MKEPPQKVTGGGGSAREPAGAAAEISSLEILVAVPRDEEGDMLARELLIKFQMSPRHPMVDLNKAYRKF